MQTVRVDKNDLVAKIRANMLEHEETYRSAVAAYREQQLALLERLLTDAKNEVPIDHLALSRMPVPENHMGDYRRALRMLEMEIRNEVDLEEFEYRQFVDDEWGWRKAWEANTVAYARSR